MFLVITLFKRYALKISSLKIVFVIYHLDEHINFLNDLLDYWKHVLLQFFEHGNLGQRKEFADQLAGQMLSLSLQMYGCRVIQKV